MRLLTLDGASSMMRRSTPATAATSDLPPKRAPGLIELMVVPKMSTGKLDRQTLGRS